MPEVIKIGDQNDLVETAKFPYANWKFDKFNPVQSRLMDTFEGDGNIAIAASTSAGKTCCAEMYMSYETRKRGGKSIYIGPMKALAKEKERDWTDKSHHFGDLNVAIMTGDYRFTKRRISEIEKADIIAMTPEMLASRCRNHKTEKSNFLKDVGTVAFDESHLLGVPGRGDHIEVALMKLTEINPDLRAVLLSATLPNVDEICGWVSKLTDRDTFCLESEYRPCPLYNHYEAYYDGGKYDDKEAEKIGVACGIVEYYSDDKFLIFAHTKRTGKLMVRELDRYGIKAEFHNADLDGPNRQKLEDKFRNDKNFRVVIATSTLAWGCYKHGSRVSLPDGSLRDVADVACGDELLCPVGNKFLPRRVVRERDFHKEWGYYVRLESGETMEVSSDHVFYAAKDRNSPDWVDVSQLHQGDFLGTPMDYGMWHEDLKSLDSFWYLVGFSFGDGCLCDCGEHADGSQKAVLDLCIGKDRELQKIVSDKFMEVFGETLSERLDKQGVIHLVTKKKKIVDKFLPHLPLGRKMGSDDLPCDIKGDRLKIASFLRGLFDADGGPEDHSNGNTSIGLTNISKRAIESVRNFLLCFGIRSSFGKKKMRGSVINGRYQPPRRKYSYRLRVFGFPDINRYMSRIGFECPNKKCRTLDYVESKSDSWTKDLIPARELLEKHLEKNGMGSSHFKTITNCGLWNSLHKQDCRRDAILKLLNSTDNKSKLNDLLESPIYWSRIKEIGPCEGGTFKELELEEPHAYVGNGVISHNCNLPARRVIILGIHRGLQVVENYDIWQMVGRSGRVGLDPQGDAYILVPESEQKATIASLKKKPPIRSTLLEFVGKAESPHYKTLAFHVVSEIHQGNIKTKEGFHKWARNTLAHYQDLAFDDTVIDRTLDLLQFCRAIWWNEEESEYVCTGIGKVASMMYYSPFDVSDLKKNFEFVFDQKQHDNDHALAMAMANVDSFRWVTVSRDERSAITPFNNKIEKLFGIGRYSLSTVKAGFCYYNMMLGKKNDNLASFQGMLQSDLDRAIQVVLALDTMSGKWGEYDFIRTLGLRFKYGVKADLVQLCQIPNIGQARAKKLKAAGVSTLDDFLGRSPDTLRKIMKCGENLVKEAYSGAQKIKAEEMIK